MRVKLISFTAPAAELRAAGVYTAECLIVHNARVSNPNNQLNVETGNRLIKYCIDHQHWSIFEQAFMTVEVKTSRAIAAQILRHRSFTFQEFSQRYAEVQTIQDVELRQQAKSNRQSSSELVPATSYAHDVVARARAAAEQAYKELLTMGVARECARMVLPLSTETVMYMSGSCRSFIHYIDLRCKEDTQKEHRDIANNIKSVFKEVFPLTAAAKGY